MKSTRKGLGKGMGTGYKNIVPMDSHIHSLSAKGQKSYWSPYHKKMDAMGYMHQFKIDKEYSIIAYSEGTRSGFRHMAKLMRNGSEVESAKVTYLNRTWESYQFQTVMHKLLEKYFDEKKAKEMITKLEERKNLYAKGEDRQSKEGREDMPKRETDPMDMEGDFDDFTFNAKRDLVKEMTSTKVADRDLVRLMTRRLNDGKITQDKIFERYKDKEKSFIVGKDLEKQGYDYLNNLRRTPQGRERKNNPFSSWEEETLDNFDHFELRQFIDLASPFARQSGMHYYRPVWTVVAKDGSEFDYYWSGDGIKITG